MSDTCKQNLIKGMQKTFKDFEVEILPKYTQEQIIQEIEKGEKSFFTPKAIEEFKTELEKAENVSEEISTQIVADIKKLEKVAIIKGDNIEGFGYFLEKDSIKKD